MAHPYRSDRSNLLYIYDLPLDTTSTKLASAIKEATEEKVDGKVVKEGYTMKQCA